MPLEISPLPSARLGSHQLPLPLGLPAPPPPAPTIRDVVGPQQVWPRLAATAQAHLRQTFVRVIQEVLDDGDLP